MVELQTQIQNQLSHQSSLEYYKYHQLDVKESL